MTYKQPHKDGSITEMAKNTNVSADSCLDVPRTQVTETTVKHDKPVSYSLLASNEYSTLKSAGRAGVYVLNYLLVWLIDETNCHLLPSSAVICDYCTLLN